MGWVSIEIGLDILSCHEVEKKKRSHKRYFSTTSYTNTKGKEVRPSYEKKTYSRSLSFEKNQFRKAKLQEQITGGQSHRKTKLYKDQVTGAPSHRKTNLQEHLVTERPIYRTAKLQKDQVPKSSQSSVFTQLSLPWTLFQYLGLPMTQVFHIIWVVSKLDLLVTWSIQSSQQTSVP